MEARASFRGAPLSPAVVRVFMVVLLSVFLLGGAGGYVVRGLSSSVSTPTTTTRDCPAGSHAVVSYTAKTWSCAPLVIEQAPYGTPTLLPAPEPTHDPSGRVISI